jgi:hypothetical protein
MIPLPDRHSSGERDVRRTVAYASVPLSALRATFHAGEAVSLVLLLGTLRGPLSRP